MAVVTQRSDNSSVVISQIITEAYRESNNIAIGQIPNAAEQQEALYLFNRFLKSVFGNEAGDPLTPISIGNNNVTNSVYYNLEALPIGWYPPRNSRLFFNNNQSQAVNLNPYPQDGERLAIHDVSGNFSVYNVTINGNGRLIDGSNQTVLNTDLVIKEYFYRADTGSWMSVSNLDLSDTFPFPVEFEDLFIIGLAMRLNPRNRQEIDPQSIQTYKRLRSLFLARYHQSIDQRPEEGLLRTPGVPYLYYRNYGPYLDNAQRFNLGWSL